METTLSATQVAVKKIQLPKRTPLVLAVLFLLCSLAIAALGLADRYQTEKLYGEVQSLLVQSGEQVPLSEATVAELNQIFGQKPYNPVRWARLTYVSIAKHPDYPYVKREGDEEIVYEFTDTKPRFWEIFTFSGLSSGENWDSYYEDTGLENMWKLDFFSSYTPKQYGMIVFGGTAICLPASGWFWYCWAKKRKQG